MSGCSNEVTVGERAWVNTCCNKACYMSNVCKRIGAHFFGYSLKCLEIKGPCICTCTYDYNLRPAFYSQLSHFIVINSPGLTANTATLQPLARVPSKTCYLLKAQCAQSERDPHDRVSG